MEQWITRAIVLGSLGGFFFLIRWVVTSNKKETEGKISTMQAGIQRIRDEYVSKESHTLMCGLCQANIENLFKNCFNKHKDDVFDKFRDIEKKFNESLQSHTK